MYITAHNYFLRRTMFIQQNLNGDITILSYEEICSLKMDISFRPSLYKDLSFQIIYVMYQTILLVFSLENYI
jgi:hypothetical protein